ncbi:MAG: AtpZ/AtpI family protein [Anaerolineales bacterium]
MTKRKDNPSWVRLLAQEAARASSLGWELALPIFLGVLLGHFLDRWLGTRYVFTLGLLVFGIFAGFYSILRFNRWLATRERRPKAVLEIEDAETERDVEVVKWRGVPPLVGRRGLCGVAHDGEPRLDGEPALLHEGAAARGVSGLFRLLAIAGLFILALRASAVGGLVAFAGLMLTRWVLIYRVHRGRAFQGWMDVPVRRSWRRCGLFR